MTTPGASATEADRLARVALVRLGEPGQQALLRQAHDQGAVRLHDQLLRESEVGRRLRAIDPAAELEEAERSGLRFVIPGDDEWPSSLDDLAVVEPLQRLGGVPLGLWVRGPLRLDELGGAVAIVGSRSSTSYGEDVAREIAATVAAEGCPVISGAAYGIDLAAHRGAVAAGGRTVAVLACGADKVYPQRSADLLSYLAAHGAVVSETPPGGAALKVRFLARNRIIAALACGTVVVEAALRSGALNTANWAGRANRAVMGVPGPVTSASSAGVHQLLRTGGATLVGSGAEVLEMVGAAGEHLLAVPRGPERVHDRLRDDQLAVLEAVPVGVGVPATSIARIANVSTDQAEALLHVLETRDLVLRDEAGWRLAALAHPSTERGFLDSGRG